MKKSILLLNLIFILLFSFFVVPPSAIGDVGDFNDYDSSDSDWGSDSDSDWGSSDSDWSSSDSDWSSDSSDDYDSDRSSSSGSGGSGFWYFLLVFFVFFIIGIILRRQFTGDKSKRSRPAAIPVAKDNTNKIVPAVQKIDPQFSNDRFITWTKEVFVTLQKAWMDRNWGKVRPFEKEELYKQHEMQLQQYINNYRINVLERISFDQAYLQKYVRDKDYEYLSVFFHVHMIDYIKDEKTGAVLKGMPGKECQMRYLYTFMRKTGVLTDPVKSNHSTTNCPNCGATLKISSAGKCEYCDSLITTGKFDWVLSNIDGVKPQTVIDNSGVIIRDGR